MTLQTKLFQQYLCQAFLPWEPQQAPLHLPLLAKPINIPLPPK